jgi:hypothetical protein
MGRTAVEKEGPVRSLSFEDADDPTTARSSCPHTIRSGRRAKAAAKAERLSKKSHHHEAVAEFRDSLALDPQYYEAANNRALELSLLVSQIAPTAALLPQG